MNKLMIVLAALCCLVSASFASTDTGTGGGKSTDTGTGGTPVAQASDYCQTLATVISSQSTDTGTGGGKSTDTGTGGGKSTDTGTGGGKSTDTGTGGGKNTLISAYYACLGDELNFK